MNRWYRCATVMILMQIIFRINWWRRRVHFMSGSLQDSHVVDHVFSWIATAWDENIGLGMACNFIFRSQIRMLSTMISAILGTARWHRAM